MYIFFQAFPHTQQQVISQNIYWVPTKEEAQALQVPFQPTLNSKISNEIEFTQSNELLVPGKHIYKHFLDIFFRQIATFIKVHEVFGTLNRNSI